MARSSKKRTGRSLDTESPEKPRNPGLPKPASVIGKKKVILGGRPVTIIKTTERDEYEDEKGEPRDQG